MCVATEEIFFCYVFLLFNLVLVLVVTFWSCFHYWIAGVATLMSIFASSEKAR